MRIRTQIACLKVSKLIGMKERILGDLQKFSFEFEEVLLNVFVPSVGFNISY